MRILAIRGRNLASLAGDFSVDFEAEPLASAGIFAITGPTGAGKSTLLDAVCLALFAEIPRLRAAPASGAVGHDDAAIGARDARSILSHGAGDAFAEVDFAMPAGGRYRAKWEVRRARGKADGRLQNYDHAFERIDTAQRMGGTRTETRAAIVGVIGLSADQFTRAVLLAQGDFEAFIRADANERAVLLERLTGSQIYTRIGQNAYAKASGLRAELDAIRQQITAQHGLDDEARAVAEAALAQAEATHAEVQTRLITLEAAERRLARRAELRAQIAHAEQAHDTALARQGEAEHRRAALAQDRAALALAPLLATRDAARQSLAQAEARQAQTREAAQTAASAAQDRKAEAEQTAAALAHSEQRARELAPDLDAARVLDRRMAEAVEALEAMRREGDARARAAQEALDAAAHAQTAHTAAEARRHAATAWRDANGALHMLAEREGEIAGLITDRAATEALRRAREAEQASLETAEHTAHTRHAAASEALRDAQQAVQTAQTRLHAAEAAMPALDHLSRHLENIGQADVLALEAAQAAGALAQAISARDHTRDRRAALALRLREIIAALAGHDHALPALEAQLAAARRVLAQSLAASDKAAQALRAGLVEGEPCPVCGAAEHPLSALDSLLGEHLEANRAQTQALEDALTQTRAEHQALLRERETLTGQERALEEEEAGQALILPALQAADTAAAQALGHVLQELDPAPARDDIPALRQHLQALRLSAAADRDALLALHAQAEAAAMAGQKDTLADALAQRRDERARLLAGRGVAEVEQEQAQVLAAARRASEAAREARETAAQAQAGAEAAVLAAQDHHTGAAQACANAAATFAQALGALAEADVTHVAAAGPGALEAEALALAAPLLAEALAAERQTAAAAREDARLTIRQDDLARERTAALRAQLEAETARADVWLRLSDLIGDREGKTLRRFAQGLTLDRLLEHANARLSDLKPRFALERGTGGDMLIQVIDNDMGGQVRGLHNLSGGERFLVSLALALGLAEMSTARGVRIESLFIDEGFGALDPSSLGQALALLEHLHATGRRVGVISHVEDLKERVPVKIEVRPTGRGTSTIEVVGA